MKNIFVRARTIGVTVATATMLFAINAQAALPAWALAGGSGHRRHGQVRPTTMFREDTMQKTRDLTRKRFLALAR